MIRFGSWISDHGKWVQKWSPQGIHKSWICLKIGYANPKWDVFNGSPLQSSNFTYQTWCHDRESDDKPRSSRSLDSSRSLWSDQNTQMALTEHIHIPFFWAGLLQIVPLEFTIYWPFGGCSPISDTPISKVSAGKTGRTRSSQPKPRG